MPKSTIFKNNAWILPEGMGELLPAEALKLEQLRRNVLDHFSSWGYDLVMPPFAEYLESLLSGTGNDLDLQTFKIVDQNNGRMMGIRSDMTPQVCRIDSHQLNKEEPTRLCYMGTVLHTKSDGFAGSRSPLQFGVELFGHGGAGADAEVMAMMCSTLTMAGVNNFYLDLGHVGIYRGLAQQAGLTEDQEYYLFDAMQRKAIPEIEQLLQEFAVKSPEKEMLSGLAMLNGGDEVLIEAVSVLEKANNDVKSALDNLGAIYMSLKELVPNVDIHFDLAELRGYHYQTGVVFAAFVPGKGQEIARGGRYDEIGEVFGKSRPATGFSSDLKAVLQLSESETEQKQGAIYAPYLTYASSAERSELFKFVTDLRSAGETVIYELEQQLGDAAAMGCDRVIVKQDDNWVVEAIS